MPKSNGLNPIEKEMIWKKLTLANLKLPNTEM
jgi:hypothetical protein